MITVSPSFVTTSAGDPNKYCEALKSKGLTVFHVVPSLAAIQMVGPRLGWAAGSHAIYVTTDGAHWTKQYASTQDYVGVDLIAGPGNPDLCDEIAAMLDVPFCKTTVNRFADGRRTLEQVVREVIAHQAARLDRLKGAVT